MNISNVLISKSSEYRMSSEMKKVLSELKFSEEENAALTMFFKHFEAQSWNEGYDDCLMDASPKKDAE